jgi:DNA-nicking Smr family endonuclease
LKGKRAKAEVPSEAAPPEKGRQGARALSAEDEALWKAVAATITPIEKQPAAIRVTIEPKPPALRPARTGEPVPPPKASARSRPAPPAVKPPPKAAEPPAFEVKRARKLRRGALEIEDLIDLYGMRQAEAHRALRAFLLSAHARGLSHVKIITGKGRSDSSPERPFELHARERPGVLKRLLPVWLGEPDIAAVVVSYTGAGRQHGGDGALYVHLRRRKAVRP